MGLTAWLNDIRKFFLRTGYTCDGCGGEVFDYPARRLCASCEEKLLVPLRPCELCGREKRAEGICVDCKAMPPKYERGISPFVYKGEGALLINRFKGGNAKLAAYFGEKMGEKLWETCAELHEIELLLLPVPCTKEGKRERGFNQAERLTESVRDVWTRLGGRAEMDVAVLEKRAETKQQKKMSRKERMENVRDAYVVTARARCKGRIVALVDDVMTTGSTGNEIAKKLLKAGAERVYFLTAGAVCEQK